MEFLKILKMEVPFDGTILLVGVRPKERQSVSHTEIRLHARVHCGIICNGQDRETTFIALHGEVDKEHALSSSSMGYHSDYNY